MDFELTPEQAALRESVDRFIERDYGWEQRHAVVASATGQSPTHWATFAELGWLGAGLSEGQGGFGGGATENAVLLESFGRGLVVEPLVAHIVAVNILAGATGERAATVLGAAVMGDRRVIVAHGAGQQTDRLATAVTLSDGVLSGKAEFVHGAGAADTLIVSAIDAAGAVSLHLVDRAAAGVSLTPYRTIDDHRVATITFDHAQGDALDFADGAAAALARALDHGIVALCAESVGAMHAALMLTRDYLLTRKQFGVAIGSFQALQHRMADMLIDTEMARSILYHAIGAMDGEPQERLRAVSAAKAMIGPAGIRVGAAAIQLHGGIGMTEEYMVGHYYKRLYAIERLLGSSHDHRDVFARLPATPG